MNNKNLIAAFNAKTSSKLALGWNMRYSLLVASITTVGLAGPVQAFPVDTGNPDLDIRWDNSLRYTLGVRAEGRDSKISHTPSADEGDAKFDKGDVIANRVDLLSEFDFVYKRRHGFRLSGDAWYNQAYADTKVVGADGNASSYDNGHYSSYTKRYYRGPSGELLDAFAFTGFDLGTVPVNIKAGRHVVVWGEGLLIGAHAISYRQAPSDGRKGAENPGAETKELFLPVGQVSFQSSLSDTLSLGGQYYFDWEPDRLPEGGTYLGSTDYLWEGPDQWVGSPGGTTRRNGGSVDPHGQDEWGLNMRWSPKLLNGATIGAYYRQFDERQPWIQIRANDYRLMYAEDTRLYGLSYNQFVGDSNFGFEVSYRENAALIGSANSAGEGPRGDTLHAIANASFAFPNLAHTDNALLSFEVAYSKLEQVTDNPELFRGKGYGGCPVGSGKWQGCATDEVWLASTRFTPQWYGVWDGSVDVSIPMAITEGLKGNGATMSGGNQGTTSYSIGVEGVFLKQYIASLAYTGSYAHYQNNENVVTGGNGAWALNDRDRITLTLKTTF
ncbi:DUF1302 domain-containing protein [Pseudomonas sp. NFX224]|uniref:DUF1302 domain-containing protein n=1 Tax=Pseudomonas sp. NFX224 TaxID=3402862 RepID=UPI003AFA5D88